MEIFFLLPNIFFLLNQILQQRPTWNSSLRRVFSDIILFELNQLWELRYIFDSKFFGTKYFETKKNFFLAKKSKVPYPTANFHPYWKLIDVCQSHDSKGCILIGTERMQYNTRQCRRHWKFLRNVQKVWRGYLNIQAVIMDSEHINEFREQFFWSNITFSMCVFKHYLYFMKASSHSSWLLNCTIINFIAK